VCWRDLEVDLAVLSKDAMQALRCLGCCLCVSECVCARACLCVLACVDSMQAVLPWLLSVCVCMRERERERERESTRGVGVEREK